MALTWGRGCVEPLERVTVEEGPVWDGDERREHDAAGVDEQHELEVRAHVAHQERRHRGRHQQHLHQHLRALLPQPIHDPLPRTRETRDPSEMDRTRTQYA